MPWAQLHATQIIGKTILNQFDNTELSKGNFLEKHGQATVYKVTAPRFIHPVVAKQFNYDQDFLVASNELDVLMRLQSHSNIVHIYGYIIKNEDYSGYLMEFCPGGSLQKVIMTEGYEIKDIVRWMAQAVCGLMFLHEHGLIHRDVKPANDLGTAKTPSNGGQLSNNFNGEQKSTFEHGTPGYQAPEIANGEKYTNKVDVFSLGRSLWQLLYKEEYPIKHFVFNKPVGELISGGEVLIDASKIMTEEEPTNRPTMAQIFETFKNWDGKTPIGFAALNSN